MKTKQVLPYVAALLLLAWAIGSLARSGTSGAGILSNSYWLVYLVYLIPLLGLGAMVVMVVYVAFNWRLISDALGFGMALRKRQARKQNSTLRLMVIMGFWALAFGVLFYKCGGIFCTNNSNQTLTNTVTIFANDTSPAPPQIIALQNSVSTFAGIVGSGWFGLAFLAMLVLSSVILIRSIKVSMDETRAGRFLPARVREEGTIAVQDALKVLEMDETGDPRTRIIACYERMIRAAASLGANVGMDRTARELENGIRNTFQLKGNGIRVLTQLFEEARYSLHTITENDSQQAIVCLGEIGQELKSSATLEI